MLKFKLYHLWPLVRASSSWLLKLFDMILVVFHNFFAFLSCIMNHFPTHQFSLQLYLIYCWHHFVVESGVHPSAGCPQKILIALVSPMCCNIGLGGRYQMINICVFFPLPRYGYCCRRRSCHQAWMCQNQTPSAPHWEQNLQNDAGRR